MATTTRKPATSRKPANSESAEQHAELQAAAELVLERERKRIRRAKTRSRIEQRQRERDQLAAVQHMQQSIEWMKWCIVIITTIMCGGVLVAIWTLTQLRAEVVKVQAEVEKVQPQVEKIIDKVSQGVADVERVRESLRNPMQSIGNAFGQQLDAKLQNLIGNQSDESDH